MTIEQRDFSHRRAVRGRSIRQRFDEKVRRTRGCWYWVASRANDRYGRLMIARRPVLAHRVSWMLHRGPIPSGMFVCHHCDNPLCVRPDHLFIGTNADNVRDACRKGRANHAAKGLPGEKNANAKLTAAKVLSIRSSRDQTRLLAARYGVDTTTIQRIRAGAVWTHL